MRTFKLIKLFLKNNLKKGEKKSKGLIAALIVSAVALIPFIVFTCIIINYISMETLRLGIHLQFLATLVTGSVMPVLIFGVISMLNVIIFSRDNDFLSSLPVKRTEIFLAKFFMVYLDEFLVIAAIFIPICITFGVTVGAGAVFYLAMPIVLILMPLFALVVCAILVFPIMYLVTFFRKHTAMSAVILILAFGGIMALYFSAVSGIGDNEELPSIILTPQIVGVMNGIWQYFIPAKFAAQFMIGTQPILGALGLIVSAALALCLAVLIAVPLYKRSITLQSESKSIVQGKDVDERQSPVLKAWIVRDFKQLLRYPAFAFQCFAGVVMVPLITAIMPGIMTGEISAEAQMNIPSSVSIGMIMFYGLMLLAGTNYTASAAFTREGETFYYNKILPVSPREIMQAKLVFANIVTIIGTVLTVLSAIIFSGIGILEGLGIGICFASFGMGLNAFSIKRDLKMPKLKWANVNEAIKNNFYMAVPMFIGMGVGLVLMILSIVLLLCSPEIGVFVADLIFWLASLTACITTYFVASRKYYDGCEERFERIEP